MRLISLITALLIMPVALAWYDTDFKYQRCFDLINVPNLTYSNYIIKIDISGITKAKPDYSDLIVVYNDTTKIPRFIANNYLYFPIDLNPGEAKKYCLYYGNPSYNEYNNITIFNYSDDFEYRFRLNWTTNCVITDTDKYTGFYSLYCRAGQSASITGLSGNEYSIAYVGTLSGFPATNTWSFVTRALTSSSLTFTATKDTYLDTFLVRSVRDEPKLYWYPEAVYGYSVQYIKSYCEDSYLSTEQKVCIYENCTINKTSIYCEYGCSEGRCIESPFDRSVRLVLVAVGLMFLFWIVWRMTR